MLYSSILADRGKNFSYSPRGLGPSYGSGRGGVAGGASTWLYIYIDHVLIITKVLVFFRRSRTYFSQKRENVAAGPLTAGGGGGIVLLINQNLRWTRKSCFPLRLHTIFGSDYY